MGPFQTHRAAALALLASAELTTRAAGFCGQVTVLDDLTAKQARWLDQLLQRAGLPPMADDESC